MKSPLRKTITNPWGTSQPYILSLPSHGDSAQINLHFIKINRLQPSNSTSWIQYISSFFFFDQLIPFFTIYSVVKMVFCLRGSNNKRAKQTNKQPNKPAHHITSPILPTPLEQVLHNPRIAFPQATTVKKVIIIERTYFGWLAS